MAREETNYRKEAEEDAKDTVENFIDEIVEMLVDKGEASDDLLNDYPNGDSYHHEHHTDKDYDLRESADLLDQLSDYEEDDEGLWQGLEPRRAIAAQAAYTYGNAVYSDWRDLIEKINDDAADVLSEFSEKRDELENEQSDLQVQEGGEDWTEAKAKKLDSMEGQLEALERRLKRELEKSIYLTMDRKRPTPYGEGPREWVP